MATIHSLPLELIRLSLHYAELHILYADERGEYEIRMVARNRLLRKASLVCKSWRVEGQSLMWEELHIAEEEQATSLVRSPSCGRFTTKELYLEGRYIPDFIIHTLVGGMVNLKHLTLYNFLQMKTILFYSPNLKGLVTLNLEGAFYADDDELSLYNPLSSLRRLRFTNYYLRPYINDFYFRSNSSMTELYLLNEERHRLFDINEPPDPREVSLVRMPAPTLRILELNPVFH